MVDSQKLRGCIVANGLTQEEVAKSIGIAPKTFYTKMKKGIFASDEIEKMMDILEIDNPMTIFFAR